MLVKLVFGDLSDFVRSYRGQISEEGMLLLSADELPKGAVVELLVCLSDGLDLIRGRAGVVASHRIERPSGSVQVAAVRFVELEDESRALIRRLTERHQSEGVPPFDLEALLGPSNLGPSLRELAGLELPWAELAEGGSTSKARKPASGKTAALHRQPATSFDDGAGMKPSIAVRAGLTPPLPQRSRFWRLIGVLALALLTAAVVVAVAVLFFPELVGLRSTPDTSTAIAPVPTATATAAAQASVPAPSTATPQTSTPAANPSPTPAPPTPIRTLPGAVSDTGARQVLGLSWDENESESVVRIECDHPLLERQLTHFRIRDDGDPRHVFKIAAIQESKIPYSSPIQGRRLAAIRSWHHTETSPPELHLVVDFASPAVKLHSLELLDSSLVLHFVGP